MALLWFDECGDSYATAAMGEVWTSVTGMTVTAGGRKENCLSATAQLQYVQKTCFGGVDEVIIGFALKTSGLPTTAGNWGLGGVGSGSVWECALVLLADGTLQVGRINNAAWTPGYGYYYVLLGSATPFAISEDVWYYIEWKIKIHGTLGSTTIKVNGAEWISLDTLNTQASSNVLTRFGLGYAGAGTTLFDDVYAASLSGGTVTDFLGDSTAEALLPEVDGSPTPQHQDWSCNTGTDHGALVDDASPDGDTTYLYTGSNVKETFQYPDLSVANATIHGVMVSTSAKKSDTGTAEFKNLAVPTTVDNQGANTHAPSDASYSQYQDIWETNPDDSSVWIVSDINGGEFGVERTA